MSHVTEFQEFILSSYDAEVVKTGRPPRTLGDQCMSNAMAVRVEIETIKLIIDQYPINRSAGPDGMSTPLRKALSRSHAFVWWLRKLFGTCVRFGIVPSEWSHCTPHMIPKDCSQTFPDKSRPISVSCLIQRIFEKLLLKTWREDREHWMGLEPTRAGFRAGYNTMSHILLSDEMSRRGKPLSIFLDIKAAYDSVSWILLDQELIEREVPSSTRHLIRSLMMRPAQLSLNVNHIQIAEPIRTQRGLFQGSILSPLLFTIFIDNLASLLVPNALLFADVIVIKAKDHQEAGKVEETMGQCP
eukprot:Sdes_comp20987_c1_seq2m19521